MKNIIILIMLVALSGSLRAQIQQPKWYAINKNQMVTMGLEMTAGYVQGWREEILYHPNALFRNFPKLNPNFFDNRISWQKGNIIDANHLAKGIITGLHLVAVVIKVGDIKKYKGWNKVKKIGGDLVKHYVAYQIGFFLAYNVTHKNPINGK